MLCSLKDGAKKVLLEASLNRELKHYLRPQEGMRYEELQRFLQRHCGGL